MNEQPNYAILEQFYLVGCLNTLAKVLFNSIRELFNSINELSLYV